MRSTPSTEGRATPRGTTGRAAVALHLLLFSATVAAASRALRPALPAGDVPDARSEIKLSGFADRKDEIDTLFLGSSRAFRGFVPEVFDRATADGGVPTRSFNFGVPGARAMEIHRTLERIGRLEPRRLRWVFVDPEGFEVLLEERNYLSRAVVDWHDLETTLLVCDYILDTTRHGRATKIRLHALACLYNLANVGRGLAWVDALLGLGPTEEDVAAALGPRGDGHLPYPRPQLHRFRNKGVPDYEARVADLAAARVEPGPPAPQPLEMYRRIEERITAMGATAVFVTQPSLHLQRDLVRAAENGSLAHLLRYDDPARFPELFAAEHHFDANHLNSEGARLFSERLAAGFLALARKGRAE